MNTNNKWREIAERSRKAIDNRSLSSVQREFCIKYVYGGEFLTHKQWGERFGVTTETIVKWLRFKSVQERIALLRAERKTSFQDQCFSKLTGLIEELEKVAKSDATYVVNKGTPREDRRTDATVLDAKTKAIQTFLEVILNKHDEGKLLQQFNMNMQPGSPSLPETRTLEQIEKELHELQVLNRGEKLIDE